MARKRYQHPEPEKIGNWWYVRVRLERNGKRTRQRIKLCRSDNTIREARIIADRYLLTLNDPEPQRHASKSYPSVGLVTQLLCPPEKYDETLVAQGGGCAICRRTDRRLNIDHDHDAKDFVSAFRGLLCGHCNRGIGHFHDNPALLRAAADYLEKCAK